MVSGSRGQEHRESSSSIAVNGAQPIRFHARYSLQQIRGLMKTCGVVLPPEKAARSFGLGKQHASLLHCSDGDRASLFVSRSGTPASKHDPFPDPSRLDVFLQDLIHKDRRSCYLSAGPLRLLRGFGNVLPINLRTNAPGALSASVPLR